MDTQQQTSVGDFLNNAQREQNDGAKTWWWGTRVLQLVVLIIGIVITVWNILPTELAIIASLLSVGSVITQWVADHRKGNAQAIHRKFEFLDALGWEVSSQELRNLHVILPKGVKAKLDKSPNSPYTYFASKTPRSPRRLMENLTESSFFSRHLAMRSAQIFGAITVVVFLLAIVMLLLALQASPTQTTGIVTAKIFVAVLGFLFTAGFIRLTYDFYRFSQISSRAEDNACTLLKQTDIELEEAIKLYHEYQLARASSPLIPTLVWKSMRDELNKRWEQYNQP
jgi:uncharacterized membrane protein YkgB